jgi:glycosyltransferase involved in cell wall biosynthesis
VGQLHTGGLERQLYYLLRTIDRDRYRPAVAVWRYSEGDVHVPPIQALGVPLYSVSDAPSRMAKLKAFRQLVRTLEPEVVHSYSFHTNIAASWGTVGTRAVAVGSIRSDFDWAKKESGALLGRLSARWPADQICNSAAAAAAARRSRSFFAPGRCHVVRNGLDLERFRPSPVATDGPCRIVGLGYLLPVKRWDRLLGAAQVLKRRGLDYRIDIVGDGPLRGVLEQRAQALDVVDRVRFVAHTDDVPGLLARASFLVLTSESEGCPNAVMEAMACGRAVVSTNVGDVSSLVEDGQAGFLVRPDDDLMLAERIATLVADRALCRQMGNAARARAERDFGLDHLARETLAAYRTAGWREQVAGASSVEALAGE